MYVHPAFRIDRREAVGMLRRRAFGTLFVSDEAGRPAAAHLPFLVRESEDGGLVIELHVARNNRLHESVTPDGRPALLTCQGPDAYVSPDWYGVPNQVPTWVYTAVHLTGIVRSMPEADGWAHVDRLSAEFEERLQPKKPWTADKMDPQRRAAMMKAIVTMELNVAPDGVEGQEKLIQHKGEVEHRGAISGLRQRGDATSIELAAMMESVLQKRIAVE